jgi:hypothetical protein
MAMGETIILGGGLLNFGPIQTRFYGRKFITSAPVPKLMPSTRGGEIIICEFLAKLWHTKWLFLISRCVRFLLLCAWLVQFRIQITPRINNGTFLQNSCSSKVPDDAFWLLLNAG